MILYTNQSTPESIKSNIIFATIMLIVSVVMMDLFIPNADMIIAERIFQASISATVVVVYWPDARAAWQSNSAEKGDYLIVGITIGWVATFCQAMFSVIFRLAGNPWWFANSDLTGMWILMSSISGVLHLVAPGALDGKVPRRNRYGLGLGIGVAISSICIVMWSRPDISQYVEFLRPVLEDVVDGIVFLVTRLARMVAQGWSAIFAYFR